METYSATEIIKILKAKNIAYFSLNDFGRLFNFQNQNSLYKRIQRLEKEGVIRKLIKGKYSFQLLPENDYLTANFLYQPSYISLETALSFYGVLTGFPYKILSLTTKKTRSFRIDRKEFIYSHINQELFWGYEKKDEFLIADKEKAFLDYLYFYTKGLRAFDQGEFDLSEMDKNKLYAYARRFTIDKLYLMVKKII